MSENKPSSTRSLDSRGDAKGMTKRDAMVGGVIVVAAQLACASTASCIHALPVETPSVLRGLWRQTLTTLIFLPLAAGMYFWTMLKNNAANEQQHHRRSGNRSVKPDEEGQTAPLLLDKESSSASWNEKPNHQNSPSETSTTTTTTTTKTSSFASKATFVLMAMAGAALLNDTMVIALQYASSAAVMCLINTTPIWLILYSIVTWTNPPGCITVVGAVVSMIGAVICATSSSGNDDDGDDNNDTNPSTNNAASNEQLGSIIATFGALGGAMYMTACRKLSPLGIHPVILTFMINFGMMSVSTILCLATIEGGISFVSTDITRGFFGFVNPQSNPAALFQSVFPDCFGNFGIMLALGYFEPLIVSMIMLTEPLNASLIAMTVVHEEAPSQRTVIGVSVVLVGCAIVLWNSSREGKQASDLERELEQEVALTTAPTASERRLLQQRVSMTQQRRRSTQVVLLSTIGTYAPDITAKAGWRDSRVTKRVMRKSLTPHMLRKIGMSSREQELSSILEEEDNINHSARRVTMPSSFRRSIYGTFKEDGQDGGY